MKFSSEIDNQRRFAKNFIDEMSNAKDIREAGLFASKAKRAMEMIIEELEMLLKRS